MSTHKKFLALAFLSLIAITQIASAEPINTAKILHQSHGLNSTLLNLGIKAYHHATQKNFDKSGVVTLIDYTLPAKAKRLWVINLKQNRVLFNTYVSQGKHTGEIFARYFSNQMSSLKTSIGVFETDAPYQGKHGLSLRLRGLEKGYNDNAYRRDIVIHPAWYASEDFVKRFGRTGRTWGCFGVSQKISTPMINAIKDHSLLISYYPDKTWLQHSEFFKA